MTSARRPNSGSRSGGTQLSASHDVDRNDELYSRNIAPWRPDINASDARPSLHDIHSAYDRQPVKIAGVPRVS